MPLPPNSIMNGQFNTVNDAIRPGQSGLPQPNPGASGLSAPGDITAGAADRTITLSGITAAPSYNVGLPRDAYFFQHTSPSAMADNNSVPNLLGANGPTALATMDDLWRKAGGHKGMVVRYYDPTTPASFTGALPSSFSPNASSMKRYGFQFHYNPSTISMTYAGVSDVDPYYEAAGQDKAVPAGVGMSQSSISLEVLLNRRFDFKYYDTNGHLKSNAPTNLYLPRTPSTDEQVEIYNKGTMYDVEFLIASLVGFKAQSRLRGLTADLGFLVGYPVELHLSNAMRYLGVITAITVDHAYFDSRMVPIYSTVGIQFNRLPDYA